MFIKTADADGPTGVGQMMNQDQEQRAERNAQEEHERQQPGDSEIHAAVQTKTFQRAETRQNRAEHHHHDGQSAQAETGFWRIRRIGSERIHIYFSAAFCSAVKSLVEPSQLNCSARRYAMVAQRSGVGISGPAAPISPLPCVTVLKISPSVISTMRLSCKFATAGMAPIFLVMPLPSPSLSWQGAQ